MIRLKSVVPKISDVSRRVDASMRRCVDTPSRHIVDTATSRRVDATWKKYNTTPDITVLRHTIHAFFQRFSTKIPFVNVKKAKKINGVLEKITSSISTSLDVRPNVQIFKRPKNREDGSKFDDFRTKWIVSARPISGKIFEITKQSKSFRKTSKNFRKNLRKIFRTM